MVTCFRTFTCLTSDMDYIGVYVVCLCVYTCLAASVNKDAECGYGVSDIYK